MTSLSNPGVSFNPVDYVDKEALAVVLGFISFLRFCEFVCIGRNVEGFRMNGRNNTVKQDIDQFL